MFDRGEVISEAFKKMPVAEGKRKQMMLATGGPSAIKNEFRSALPVSALVKFDRHLEERALLQRAVEALQDTMNQESAKRGALYVAENVVRLLDEQIYWDDEQMIWLEVVFLRVPAGSLRPK